MTLDAKEIEMLNLQTPVVKTTRMTNLLVDSLKYKTRDICSYSLMNMQTNKHRKGEKDSSDFFFPFLLNIFHLLHIIYKLAIGKITIGSLSFNEIN